jgi:NUMOD4 motif/HNH endonuclease
MSEGTAERWRPIPGQPGYEVSDHGRVRSLDRVVLRSDGQQRRYKGKPRRPAARGKGHLWIEFREGARSVHSMVLEAFVEPRPPGMWGCHEDDDPTNNHLPNLRWATPVDNHADMQRNSGHYESNKTHCKRGHELVEPNLTQSGMRQGKRICLACARGGDVARVIVRNGGAADLQAIADAYYTEIRAGRWLPRQRRRSQRPSSARQVGTPDAAALRPPVGVH